MRDEYRFEMHPATTDGEFIIRLTRNDGSYAGVAVCNGQHEACVVRDALNRILELTSNHSTPIHFVDRDIARRAKDILPRQEA